MEPILRFNLASCPCTTYPLGVRHSPVVVGFRPCWEPRGRLWDQHQSARFTMNSCWFPISYDPEKPISPYDIAMLSAARTTRSGWRNSVDGGYQLVLELQLATQLDMRIVWAKRCCIALVQAARTPLEPLVWRHQECGDHAAKDWWIWLLLKNVVPKRTTNRILFDERHDFDGGWPACPNVKLVVIYSEMVINRQ